MKRAGKRKERRKRGLGTWAAVVTDSQLRDFPTLCADKHWCEKEGEGGQLGGFLLRAQGLHWPPSAREGKGDCFLFFSLLGSFSSFFLKQKKRAVVGLSKNYLRLFLLLLSPSFRVRGGQGWADSFPSTCAPPPLPIFSLLFELREKSLINGP